MPELTLRILSPAAAIPILASGVALANPVSCSNGELTRQIEVVYSDPGQPVPCEVIYDKSAEGSIQTLWRASNEAGYCEAQAAGLVEKLSSLGWQCDAAAIQPTPEAEDSPD